MELSSLKRDPAKIDGGEWVGDIQGMDDLRLKVRGLSSPVVTNLRARKERKVPRKDRLPTGQLKTDVAIRVLGEVLAEVVLLDWDGLTDNGVAIPYSKKLALKYLTEREYQTFADAVTWAANQVDGAQGEAQDELEGNSERSSDGNSTTATELE